MIHVNVLLHGIEIFKQINSSVAVFFCIFRFDFGSIATELYLKQARPSIGPKEKHWRKQYRAKKKKKTRIGLQKLYALAPMVQNNNR